jgi:hypothetical protein
MRSYTGSADLRASRGAKIIPIASQMSISVRWYICTHEFNFLRRREQRLRARARAENPATSKRRKVQYSCVPVVILKQLPSRRDQRQLGGLVQGVCVQRIQCARSKGSVTPGATALLALSSKKSWREFVEIAAPCLPLVRGSVRLEVLQSHSGSP